MSASDYERGVQDAGRAALPYIDPAHTVDLMHALAVLAGNYPGPPEQGPERPPARALNECVPTPPAGLRLPPAGDTQ